MFTHVNWLFMFFVVENGIIVYNFVTTYAFEEAHNDRHGKSHGEHFFFGRKGSKKGW